jgi:hypothetical protein
LPRISWRRELPPVIAVAGLAADYLSPPALWTMLLPFGCVMLLLAMRKWVHAAAVFLLCSWVLIPTAARTAVAFEAASGTPRLYVLPDASLPSLDEAVDEAVGEAVGDPRVPSEVRFRMLPIGSGHVINPRWVLADVIATFADYHNEMVIARARADANAHLNE